MKIYHSIAGFEADRPLSGYMRPLRRAWEAFALTSVLCVEGVPTLYHKESNEILADNELKELHRLFWNQGIASVLTVVDPKSAYIFSGFVSPAREGEPLGRILVTGDKQNAADFLQKAIKNIYVSVASGEFYRRYAEKFQATGSVDEYLTANLRFLQKLLTDDRSDGHLSLDDAHNFICRLLFACYLVDRAIVPLPSTKKKHLYEALIERDDAEAKEYLYHLFKSLKNKFNGSMFDQDLDVEQQQISLSQIAKIKSFLNGDKVDGRQRSLGFWAYDFKLIPVETISGLYENFLGWDDKNINGAYYTPRFLAEMTLDVVCGANDDWTKRRYLDPCCGSGIFLVSLFNRLATFWEFENRAKETADDYYEIKAEALLNILRTQVRGIDQKKSACVLACFSLYVALLDSFNPSDIKTYIEVTGHKLPKLFLQKGTRPTGKDFIPVIYEDDTLTTSQFEPMTFDMAIGNPPWKDRGSKQLALQFLDRLDTLLMNGGQACLLLPSKIFLNDRTDSFQSEWLREHTVKRVVQLADFSLILFPESKCPCMIVHYLRGKYENSQHQIIYDAPKFNLSSRRQGLVVITEADRKSFPQAKVAWLAGKNLAHVFWKNYLWGTARDQRLLQYLEQFPKLEDRAGSAKSKKPWEKGQGIQPDHKERLSGDASGVHPRYKPQFPWWSEDHLFVDANNDCLKYSMYLMPSDVEPVGSRFHQLYFSRADNRVIFEPPLVIVSQGFSKVAFCDFPVLYQDSLQGIHGPQGDEDLLLFLTAYLRSDLARYYCFHTSSTWGVERDVVRFKEMLKLPFPLPDQAPNTNAAEILSEVAKCMRSEHKALKQEQKNSTPANWEKLRRQRSEKLQDSTNELIYSYFNIADMERWLIEDTINIFAPSSTPANPNSTDLPTLVPVDKADSIEGYGRNLGTYAYVLTSTLNKWAKELGSDWRLNASGRIGLDNGLATVTLHLGHDDVDFKLLPSDDGFWKNLYDNLVQEQVTLKHERQLLWFEETELHIVRPITLIHWTRTAAQNDADHIFALIQSMRSDTI